MKQTVLHDNMPGTYEDRIGYLLKAAAHRIRLDMDAALARHQLTTPQYAALSAINTHSRLSNADLARQSFVSPQTMNQILRSLLSSGFVTRTADPNHGRRLIHLLTPDGEQALSKADEIVSTIDQQMIASLSESDVVTLRDILQRYGR